MLFYIIVMVFGTIAVYRSSRNTFLTAKEDMIERDLISINSRIAFPEVMSWFFDYSKQHIDEIKDSPFQTDKSILFDINEHAQAEGKTVNELIDTFSQEEKLQLAKQHTILWL